MAFNPATALSADTTWPSVWSMDMGFLVGTTATFEEHDTVEAVPTGTGTVNVQVNNHEWQITGVNLTNTGAFLAQNIFPTGSTFTAQNRYGSLIIPASKNTINSSGLNQSYLNGVWIGEQGYVPGATFSAGDNASAPVFLGGGPSWPAVFDFVKVFIIS